MKNMFGYHVIEALRENLLIDELILWNMSNELQMDEIEVLLYHQSAYSNIMCL